MPEYTVLAVLAALAVVAAELRWFRTGIFRARAYWIAMGICYFFMVWVNGWLTKLSAPIVLYNPDMRTPWRFPWDIPVEDYVFGFAMLTMVLMLWEHAGRRERAGAEREEQPS
jgi:lycopene cyclase domain-containing protein